MLAGSGNGGGLDVHGRRGERDAGQAEGTHEVLCKLVRDGLVSVQDAAASAGVDAGEIRRALAAQG